MSVYDDIQFIEEDDVDGRRYVVRFDGKRIIANTFKELLKAMDVIRKLPENCRGKTLDTLTAGRRARRNRRKEATEAKPVKLPHSGLARSPKQWLNAIHHGDCVEIMNSMPEKSIDLVVTSPPYNIRNSTGGGLKNGSGGFWENATIMDGYDSHADDMPYEEYVAWQRECLTSMMRLLKDDGAIFYNHKWRVQDGLLQDRHEIVEGFPVRQIIIWHRSGGINFNVEYFLPTYEVIYLICKPKFKLASKDPNHPKAACGIGDVWTIPQDCNNDHPAPFPVEIPRRCIEATNARVVLDPFMGSGTTAVAATELGVDWIGIEVSEHYCRMANRRIFPNEAG